MDADKRGFFGCDKVPEGRRRVARGASPWGWVVHRRPNPGGMAACWLGCSVVGLLGGSVDPPSPLRGWWAALVGALGGARQPGARAPGYTPPALRA